MITQDVAYIGTYDEDIDLFEGQYRVPDGVTYNSYIIFDEKVAVVDTVDARRKDRFIANLRNTLDGRRPDYLIINHVEPDHAACIKAVMDIYPEIQPVCSAKAIQMLPLFYEGVDLSRAVAVKEGDKLCLGRHTLTFVMAPMVHWPEVMVTYDACDRILFSADGFGRFGSADPADPWDDEARRYYTNIAGKYGAQVQALLKKAAALDIDVVCPLHGPVLRGDDLTHALALYDTWSSYRPESRAVLVAYGSLHGNTAAAAEKLAGLLREKGQEVFVADLARCDMSEALSLAFRCDRMVLASATYDGGLTPFMADFLNHLAAKGFRGRTVGMIENGAWAPMAAKLMGGALEGMRDMTVLSPAVTLRGAFKESDMPMLSSLAAVLSR